MKESTFRPFYKDVISEYMGNDASVSILIASPRAAYEAAPLEITQTVIVLRAIKTIAEENGFVIWYRIDEFLNAFAFVK